MNSIGLVTDSAADLPPELAAAHGIEVIPLEVRLGPDVILDDRRGFNLEEFYRRVESGNLSPMTSQPPLGVFIKVYRRLLTRCPSIISIHISSTFSGTFDTANLARQALPGADITVVDSRSLSLGHGLQVIQAAKAIQAGVDKEGVLGLVRRSCQKVQVLAVLNTLEYLERGGRIGKIAFLLGSLLNVKPLVKVVDGEAISIGRLRRSDRAVGSIMASVGPTLGAGRFLFGVMHTGAVGEAGELACLLKRSHADAEVILTEAGPAIGAHIGPRAVAVAVLPLRSRDQPLPQNSASACR